MGECVRGCRHWRRHLHSCPVEDRQAGVWIPFTASDVQLAMLCDGDNRGTQLNRDVHLTKRGTLEVWHECNGCAPRKALHGALCEQCHTRLTVWLAGGTGGVAWAHRWIAADLLPSQTAAQIGKKRKGKPAPPAPVALHVHVLMADIRKALGQWLRSVTQEFGLVGPDWWSHRVEHRPDDESSWRFWLPQDQFEVNSAAQYVATWLDRAEAVPDLAAMIYSEADLLLRRVSQLAPWEPKRQRLPGLKCPECEREALTRADGDEHLSCRRCGSLVSRAKYDRWAFLLTAEREAVG